MSYIMDNKIKFCQACNNEVKIELGNTTLHGEVKGDCYIYEGIEPSTACGHFIPDDEIDKHNLKVLHDTYRTENDIISLEKIRELPQKYDIGKRPLSHLLAWGELTFTRYYNGDIPSKAYSVILKDIYNNPQKYLEILEANKEFITKKTYEKSKIATQNLLQNSCKINDVLHYILYKCQDITPLATQKLLYYCQGFYFAFNNKELFEDDCYATINGPVYLNIYNKLIKGDYPHTTEFDLTYNEKIILDNVIDNIACYSGKILTSFTVIEPPYTKAKGELLYNSNENPIIKKDDIFEYFVEIINKYKMISPINICNYSQDIFRCINNTNRNEN